MIRFIRNLILAVIIISAAAWIVALFSADTITRKAQGPLTRSFIGVFGPGPDDEYGYDVKLHILPPSVEITNLHIEAKTLKVDNSNFQDCILSVDRIECDLWDLMYHGEVTVREIEGRHFQGGLTNSEIANRIEREGGPITDLTVDWYNGMTRIQGRFGLIGVSRVTLLGRWGIDDRSVVTLIDRQYHNPDSPVPAGAVRILEEQTDLDIRIELLGEELIAGEVRSFPFGMLIIAHY